MAVINSTTFVNALSELIARALKVRVVSETHFGSLRRDAARGRAFVAISSFLGGEIQSAAKHSASSSGLDLLALFIVQEILGKPSEPLIPERYVVDVGAAWAIKKSNSYALEQVGWGGILVEPARVFHSSLRASRSQALDTRALWHTSGVEMEFCDAGELSSLRDKRSFSTRGLVKQKYPVTTVTLTDLLSEKDAPRFFGFLSIDCEGAELEVLQGLNFDLYRPACIAVEHNFEARRLVIQELLHDKGYSLLPIDTGNDDFFVFDQGKS